MRSRQASRWSRTGDCGMGLPRTVFCARAMAGPSAAAAAPANSLRRSSATDVTRLSGGRHLLREQRDVVEIRRFRNRLQIGVDIHQILCCQHFLRIGRHVAAGGANPGEEGGPGERYRIGNADTLPAALTIVPVAFKAASPLEIRLSLRRIALRRRRLGRERRSRAEYNRYRSETELTHIRAP